MALLHLVRHGEASAGFDSDRDPGLSPLGIEQANAVAASLAPIGPMPILVSPLRRCRETAAPLEAKWGLAATVEPAIAEVATPTADLAGRSAWLRTALAGSWSDLEPEPRAWRARLLDTVGQLAADSVLVTHFVVINAVIGAATGNDRVMIERLANTSVTVVETDGDAVRLIEAGTNGQSQVL